MPRSTSLRTGLLVLTSFLAIAIVESWPLPLHLGTHVTGILEGDTGVYIWNTWVFGHELLRRGTSPFSTDMVLGLGGPVDLSLHNYTVFADLLTLPLQPMIGVVAAFNVVYLLNFALAGCGMFLLARRTLRSTSAGRTEAWLAGLLFACSPFLVARGNGHYSLAAAAPLPFFVWCFDRAFEQRRVRDAAAAGACIAWAGYCDPYYAIYCVLLGLCLIATRVADVRLTPRGAGAPRSMPWLDVPLLLIAVGVLVVHVIGGGAIRIGPVGVSMRTLYTPTLVATGLVAARLLLTWRPRVSWSVPRLVPYVVPAMVMVGVTALLLAPELVAIGVRAAEGRMVKVPVLWRSSAPGVDLVSLVLPNPNHVLAPASMVEWIRRQPGETTASIPWVALLVVAAAWRFAGHKPNRAWSLTTLLFMSLAFGPFLRVAGYQTAVPTPWTLLRYVPIIGEARMPARFSVVVIMAIAVLFAAALAALLRRWPAARGGTTTIVAAALSFELLAAPRPLFPVDVPRVVDTIAADPRQVTVLHLPFGLRDGLTTFGQFNPAALFYQTVHHKPIMGGYLSRVSDARKTQYLQQPFLAALIRMSEGERLSDPERQAAAASGPPLAREVGLAWVVVDRARVSPEFLAVVVGGLGASLRERDERFDLYEVDGVR